MIDVDIYTTSNTIRECMLENGHIVEYDIMSRDRYNVNEKFYRFIGRGVIYKINGLPANDTNKKFFWVKKE